MEHIIITLGHRIHNLFECLKIPVEVEENEKGCKKFLSSEGASKYGVGVQRPPPLSQIYQGMVFACVNLCYTSWPVSH